MYVPSQHISNVGLIFKETHFCAAYQSGCEKSESEYFPIETQKQPTIGDNKILKVEIIQIDRKQRNKFNASQII